MLLDGCHEGKHTPRLTEVKCPKCGEWVEVFVRMGGRPGQTGTLVSSETVSAGTFFRKEVLKRIMNGKTGSAFWALPGFFIVGAVL